MGENIISLLVFIAAIAISIYKEANKSKRQAQQAENTVKNLDVEAEKQRQNTAAATTDFGALFAERLEELMRQKAASVTPKQEKTATAKQPQSSRQQRAAQPTAQANRRTTSKTTTTMGFSPDQEGARVSADVAAKPTTTAETPQLSIADLRQAFIYQTIINRVEW